MDGERLETFAKQRRTAVESQRKEAGRQKQGHVLRLAQEQQAAQDRLRTGWRGLLDKITGKQKRIEAENRERLAEAIARAQTERGNLATAQEIARKRMTSTAADLKAQHQENVRELSEDIARMKPPTPDPDITPSGKDTSKTKSAKLSKQNGDEHPRHSGKCAVPVILPFRGLGRVWNGDQRPKVRAKAIFAEPAGADAGQSRARFWIKGAQHRQRRLPFIHGS